MKFDSNLTLGIVFIVVIIALLTYFNVITVPGIFNTPGNVLGMSVKGDGAKWVFTWNSPSVGTKPFNYKYHISEYAPTPGALIQAGQTTSTSVQLDMSKYKTGLVYKAFIQACNKSGCGPRETLEFAIYDVPNILSVSPAPNFPHIYVGSPSSGYSVRAVVHLSGGVEKTTDITATVKYKGKEYPAKMVKFLQSDKVIDLDWCDSGKCSPIMKAGDTFTLNIETENPAGKGKYSKSYTISSQPGSVTHLVVEVE